MQAIVIEKVKSALVEALNLSVDAEILTTSKLKEDLGLDSMSSLNFLMLLEESINGFFVDPDTLEMTDLETVETISRYVSSQLGESTLTQFNEEALQVAYA